MRFAVISDLHVRIDGLLYGLEKKAIQWNMLNSADYAGILTMAMGLGCNAAAAHILN